MRSASSREFGFVIVPLIFFGVFIHLILLYSIFEIYYSSPIVSGTNPFVITNGRAPASRLVFISADGLRWRTFSEHPEKSPFMQQLIQNGKAAWGISQSHVPTESRPGHVALMAGFYEDVSAVARGWRHNPVQFDSIANRASNLWMWGSHDITSLFSDTEDSHLEHWDFYSSDEEDFASDDAYKLDSWVFNKVEQYLTRGNVTNRIFAEKALFFLHLLGLDTNGHGAKPNSAKYIDNIRVVDDGVKRMVEIFGRIFPDNRTAFIFTADHGMTNWGAHGSGSDDEILVPFVAWGSGIRPSTARMPSFIKQVDIAPLQAALLGTAIPCNSVGVIPLSVLDASSAYRFKAAYANLKQMFEQYRVKREETSFNSLPFTFRDYPGFSSAALSNVDAEIRRLAKSQRFDSAAAASIEWIPRVRDALRYFHQYKRFSQGVAITMLYITWNLLVYLMVTSNHRVGRRPTGTAALFRPQIFFSFILLLSALALFYQRLPFTNYLYYLMPVYILAVIWNILLENFVGKKTKDGAISGGMLIVAERYLMETFTNSGRVSSVVWGCIGLIGCLFFGALILVAFVSTFYERRVLSAIFVFLTPMWRIVEWTGDKPMHIDARKWERIWALSCVLLSVFPFMDTVGNSPRPGMVIAAPFVAVELLRRYLIHCESVDRAVASKVIRTIQRLLIVAGCLSAANFTFPNIFVTFVLRVFSWSSLPLAFLLPLIGLNYLGTSSPKSTVSTADRLVVWMASLFIAYSTLSIAYESIFMLVLSLFLISMFRLEVRTLNDLQAFSFYSADVGQNEGETVGEYGGSFSWTEWRHAILLVAIVEIAFFGTGNIASLNSFNTDAIRNFVTVFSPFLMATLLITKILLPFLQMGITFAAILSHRSNIAFSRLAVLMMFITDVMAVVFFFNLKDDGSWLDIGISISNYVICVISSISVFILLHVARLLIHSHPTRIRPNIPSNIKSNSRTTLSANRLEAFDIEDSSSPTDRVVASSSLDGSSTGSVGKRWTHIDTLLKQLTEMKPLWRWLAVIIALNISVLIWRLCSHGTWNAQLFRLQNLLAIQFIMAIFSTLIYRRVCCVVLKRSRGLRIAVRICVCCFLGLAHYAWFCFYLPESLLLSSISFICISIYAHMAVFLSVLIVVELLSDWLLPYAKIPILKSKNLHTVVALCLAFAFTCFGIVVTHREPLVRHEDVYISGLAPELDGFSIGLVTDVHVGPTVGRDRVETIVRVMNEMNADIVTVVGDLVDGFVSNLGERAKPFRLLRSRYGKFFVTGNHEYYHDDVDRWIDFFKSSLNLTVLRNNHKVIRPSSISTKEDEVSGRPSVCVVGVDDIVTEHLLIKGHTMNIEKAIAGCPQQSTIVMLAHQPNAARRVIDEAKRQIHLILSGHTHGGQFYIFWPMAYWRNAYLYGLYRDSTSGTQIYVSSGVNYWGPPVKMWDLCEVVLLRLRPGQQKIMSEFDGEPPADARPPPPNQ